MSQLPLTTEPLTLAKRSRPFWWGIALALTVLLAVILRLYGAGSKQFWSDESVTYMVANEHATMVDMLKFWWSSGRVGDPPLFYILSYLNVSDMASHDHIRLRLVPLAFGIATIPVVFALFTRLTDRSTAIIGALLMALNTFAIQYSQEYRPYSMLLFGSALHLHAMVLLLEEPARKRIGYYAASGLLLFYSHYFAGFVLAATYLIWIVLAGLRTRSGQNRFPYLAAVGLPLLFLLMGLPVFTHAYYSIIKVSPGTQSQQAMAQYFQANRDTGYSWKLIQTMGSYYEAKNSRGPALVTAFMALIGALHLLWSRLRLLFAGFAWSALAALPTFYVYERLQFPFEERRNIYLLVPYLFLVSWGALVPYHLATRLKSQGIRFAGATASALLLGLLVLANLTVYKQYYAGGYRSDSNQADWKGIAESIARVGGQDAVVDIPRGNQGWIRPTFFYYYRQFLKPENLLLFESIEEIRKSPKGNGDLWFLIVDPWNRKKELLNTLLTKGTWQGFYGGFAVFLPRETTGTVSFPIYHTGKYAVQVDGQGDKAEIELATPATNQVFRVTRPDTWFVTTMDPGIYRARLSDTARPNATSITLHRLIEPGEWLSALNVSEIRPQSSIFDVNLSNGSPYLMLMHNGAVSYRFMVPEEGDYAFEIEAKQDAPGPIRLKARIPEIRKEHEYDFGKGSNSFETLSKEFHLPAKPLTLNLSYNSFRRTGNRKPEHPDDYNELAIRRWRLVRVEKKEP